jgi:hypothetical protein
MLGDDGASDEIQCVELVSSASCGKLLSLDAKESPKAHVEFGNVAEDTDPSLSDLETPLDYWWERRTDLLDLRDEYASRAEPSSLGEVLEYSLLFANNGEGENGSFDIILDRTCARIMREVSERAGSLAEHREERKALKRSIWAQEPRSD